MSNMLAKASGHVTGKPCRLQSTPCSIANKTKTCSFRRIVRCAASSAEVNTNNPGSNPPVPSASSAAKWDHATDRLVSMASIPFSILVLPQVVQNFANMAAGNMSALSIISWEGYTSALMGNTLMCSHFANAGERSAVNVQLVGIANNLLVLLQVALASCMPKPVFAAVASLVAVAVAINVARLSGGIPDAPSQQQQQQQQQQQPLGLWRWWLLCSGVIGLSVVPQVLYNTLWPGSPSLLPGAGTLALLVVYTAFKLKSSGAAGLEQLPGWASTLLFALSPLPQLVRNFLQPSSLEGLSVGTMLLAIAGNALMVPRALLIRDRVWLAGASWACVAGWGQLASMAGSVSPTTGQRYLHPLAFAGITGVLAAYFSYVAWNDARAKSNT